MLKLLHLIRARANAKSQPTQPDQKYSNETRKEIHDRHEWRDVSLQCCHCELYVIEQVGTVVSSYLPPYIWFMYLKLCDKTIFGWDWKIIIAVTKAIIICFYVIFCCASKVQNKVIMVSIEFSNLFVWEWLIYFYQYYRVDIFQ